MEIPPPAKMPNELYHDGTIFSPMIAAAPLLSRDQFLAIISTPPGFDMVPESLRKKKMLRWQVSCLARERARLIALKQTMPPWMDSLERELAEASRSP